MDHTGAAWSGGDVVDVVAAQLVAGVVAEGDVQALHPTVAGREEVLLEGTGLPRDGPCARCGSIGGPPWDRQPNGGQIYGIEASRPGSEPRTDCQLVWVHPPRLTRYQNPVPAVGATASVMEVPVPWNVAFTTYAPMLVDVTKEPRTARYETTLGHRKTTLLLAVTVCPNGTVSAPKDLSAICSA